MLSYVAIIGPGDVTREAEPALWAAAEDVGAGVGALGAVIVCGGLEGVMAAAAAGGKRAGATTLGLLPGRDRHAANAAIDIAVPTGLGEGRNALIVRTADVVVAVGRGYGTLSEIALALRAATPVIGMSTWDVPGVVVASDADEAVRLVAARIAPGPAAPKETDQPT